MTYYLTLEDGSRILDEQGTSALLTEESPVPPLQALPVVGIRSLVVAAS